MERHFALFCCWHLFWLRRCFDDTHGPAPANGDVGGSSIGGPRRFGAPRSCSWRPFQGGALEGPRRRYEEEQMNAEAQARAAPTAGGGGVFSSMSADERVETIDSLAAASTAGRCGRSTPQTFGCSSCDFRSFCGQFSSTNGHGNLLQPTRCQGSASRFLVFGVECVDFDVNDPLSIAPISNIADECHAPEGGNAAFSFSLGRGQFE